MWPWVERSFDLVKCPAKEHSAKPMPLAREQHAPPPTSLNPECSALPISLLYPPQTAYKYLYVISCKNWKNVATKSLCRMYINCSDQHTSIYAGELLSRFEGGCQSFGCLFKFAVTNHCSLGQPRVKLYKIEKNNNK